MSDKEGYNKDAKLRQGTPPVSGDTPEERQTDIERRLRELESRERRRERQAYGLRSALIQLLGHVEEMSGLPRTIPSRKNRRTD